MWVLLIVTLVSEGTRPSQFISVKYPTYEACVHAQARAERKPATFGYCEHERAQTK